MKERNLFMFWQVIFELYSIVGVVLRQWLCSDHARDLTVSTFKSHYCNINNRLVLRHSDIGHLESKSAWEVFIQDCYFALRVVAWQSLWLSFRIQHIGVIKLNVEIKVWLPFFIVNDWNLDLELGWLISL